MKINAFFVLTVTVTTLLSNTHVASAIEVTQGYTALRLAQNLAASNVMIHGARLSGFPEQWGIFTNGSMAVGFDQGIVLASTTTNAVTQSGTDLALGGDGYAPLTNLLVGKAGSGATLDAATLTITFTCQDSADTDVGFNYVFASNEYPTNGEGDSEDLIGAFLNGKAASNNLALVDGEFVSSNNIYQGCNYISNFGFDYHLDNLQVKGLTVPLTSKLGSIKSDGVYNTLVLAVADGGGNDDVGSFVFLEKDSLRCYSSS